METIVPIVVLIVMALATVLVGLPIVDLIAKLRPGRAQRAPSTAPTVEAALMGPAFTPLVMADNGQRWPSEVPHRNTSMDLLPWPSETWKDNPFPASARIREASETAREARRVDVASRATPAPQRGRPATRPGRKRAQQRNEATAPVQTAPVVSTTPAPAQSAPQPRVVTQPSPVPVMRAEDQVTITTAEILQIANDPSRGLASAVEHVRGKTGWSFQRAAQHVAMALRNNN